MNLIHLGGLSILLAGLVTGCVPRPRPLPEAPPLLSLPTADLELLIPDLGPCCDAQDRTLRLDSRRPVMVLVHGVQGSPEQFLGLAQALASRGQQAVAFSYRERDSLMVSSGRLARSLERLARAVPGRDLIVIGHSMGGLIARKALVADRDDPFQGGARLTLVTVSTPFAGIRAASRARAPLVQALSLGMAGVISRAISGDKWSEITDNSAFIREPGRLVPQVERHLVICTDERGSRRDTARSDQVFTLAEQHEPEVDRDPRAEVLELKAGHVEIVGDRSMAPAKLLGTLHARGIL